MTKTELIKKQLDEMARERQEKIFDLKELDTMEKREKAFELQEEIETIAFAFEEIEFYEHTQEEIEKIFQNLKNKLK